MKEIRETGESCTDESKEYGMTNTYAGLNPETVSLMVEALHGSQKALRAAGDDIGELIQVAKYNLRGQINSGEIIERPKPPLLVHENGIAKSEYVIKQINQALNALNQILNKLR